MTDETVPAHLTREVTPRGFSHLPAIPSTHGGGITAYESSSAEQASIWVRVHQHFPGDDEKDAVAHLTLESAGHLRDQLDWLIKNHYWDG